MKKIISVSILAMTLFGCGTPTECDPIKKPVCGIKDGAKNGYLNECEVYRHGAKLVNEGFCKQDESVLGNCKAKITPIGNCEMDIIGTEFDGERCLERTVSGCEAEIPFVDLQSCEEKCQK
jgi:hypothetical protein